MMPLRCWLVLLFVAPLVVAGCGKKGPLRPLGEPLPQAPREANLTQQGDRLILSWSAPQRNADGSPADVAGFRIYRLPFAPDSACPECRDDNFLWRSIDSGAAGGNSADGRYRVVDDQVTVDRGYRYRIEPWTPAGFPGTSAVLSRVVQPAPPIPAAVTTEAGHGQVRLTWQVQDDTYGELLGFQVFRAAGDEAFDVKSLNRTLVTETVYDDIGLQNDLTYRYRVVAHWQRQGVRVESAPSTPVTATPQSVFE